MSRPRFTKQQQRDVLAAVAGWQPVGTSISLLDVDRQRLREQVVDELARVLELELETAGNMLDAYRMAGLDADRILEERERRRGAPDA